MEYGVGIDCVSAGEISVALKAGFDPKKIYFHGNNKLPSEIQYALENGVENFVIDNFYEIELVEEIASKLNVMVNGLVRITPGVYAVDMIISVLEPKIQNLVFQVMIIHT